jgi:2-oxo-4-hydroxy-4-carboxy-5-ureidoimidazoline decarboxylase
MTDRALSHINALDLAGFAALLGPLYEHSPWAAERAFQAGPFADVTALAGALKAAVEHASEAEKISLILAHPELAGDRLRARVLTTSSMSEQTSVGLDRLDARETARWTKLNAEYLKRFEMPFIICVRLHSKDEILTALSRRMGRTLAEERREAVRQIHDIARLRLDDALAKLEVA